MVKQRGFSLIEVAVTLALVSVTALGLAGLQTVTMRANNNALVESQAATLAQDVIERIRANPEGDYIVNMQENFSSATANCYGKNATCDRDSMARYDLLYWKCTLGGTDISQQCAERGRFHSPQETAPLTAADNRPAVHFP